MVRDYRDVDWLAIFNQYGTIPRMKKHRDKEGRDTFNIFCAFDIETSSIWLNEDRSQLDVHSFMYSWAFQMEDISILGREWEDFKSFLSTLFMASAHYKNEHKLLTEPKLIVWVHNLSYEFAFLSGIYPFYNEECFFRDARKPIYFRMYDSFEFRCSYIQTNLSLSALTKETGVKLKLSGQKFDYSKVRFPWTELTEFEEEYTTTDVQSLVQAMKYRVQFRSLLPDMYAVNARQA